MGSSPDSLNAELCKPRHAKQARPKENHISFVTALILASIIRGNATLCKELKFWNHTEWIKNAAGLLTICDWKDKLLEVFEPQFFPQKKEIISLTGLLL